MSRSKLIKKFKNAKEQTLHYSLKKMRKDEKILNDLEDEKLIRLVRKLSPLLESETIFTFKWIGS